MNRPFLPAIAFVIAYFIARGLLELVTVPALRGALAFLPLPFFAAWLWSTLRWVRGMDELERQIHLEAAAISLALSLLLFMTLGLLQLAVTLSLEDWSYRHTWIYPALFYFGGLAVARRRYA